jgi:hypothetical protein
MRNIKEVIEYVHRVQHTGTKIYFQDHNTIILYDAGKLIHYEFDTQGITISTNILKDDDELSKAKE